MKTLLSRYGAIVAMLLLSLNAPVMAQALEQLPVKEVDGRYYRIYTVKSKETVYSLCKRFNISRQELEDNNPAVADGLKAGMTLRFPAAHIQEPETPVLIKADGSKRITHKVLRGETIYGIARRYDVTPEIIIAQNPHAAEGLKADAILTIDLQKATPLKPGTPFKGYIVKEKETFYSIARQHGLSVSQLEAANPNVSALKVGQVLNIPILDGNLFAANEETQAVAANEADLETPAEIIAETTPVGNEPDDYNPAVSPRTVSIGLILPFNLNEDEPTKESRRYTEFYRGFLLAIDSLRNNPVSISIKVFDSASSLDTVRNIIDSHALEGMDVVIAPDNASQLFALAEHARKSSFAVINPFVVKDESYLTNPSVAQTNIPSALMQKKAIEAYAQQMHRFKPVFLTRNNGPDDKAEFIREFKCALDQADIPYSEIGFDERLTNQQLSHLGQNGRYAFIPTSSRQSELNRILPAIQDWKSTLDSGSETVIVGYPEWITFKGETLQGMHALNALVYSRFYTDDTDTATHDIDMKYRRWFGSDMEAAAPRQGLLGFDLAMFLVTTLSQQPTLTPSTAPYRGVQNSFSFSKAPEHQGLYNNLIYLITFLPSGKTGKILL